jgi:hypothetical protein
MAAHHCICCSIRQQSRRLNIPLTSLPVGHGGQPVRAGCLRCCFPVSPLLFCLMPLLPLAVPHQPQHLLFSPQPQRHAPGPGLVIGPTTCLQALPRGKQL